MAENQLEGAENVNEVIPKEAINNFNVIFRNILEAWNLIPLQGIEKIGELHNDVMRLCTDIKKIYDNDEVFRLLRYIAKIPYHIAKGLH